MRGQRITRARKAAATEAWHGPLTSTEIADKFGFGSAQVLRNFWQKQKNSGALPCDGHRPHFPPAHLIGGPIEATAGGVAVALDDEDEALPRFRSRVPAGDPLLTVLRLVHGADPLRGFDDVVEPDEGRTITTPSCARLRGMREVRDLLVCALIKRGGYGGASAGVKHGERQ